jgi:hypothetical protein
MKLPAPTPGLVLRYSFLWSHERDAGREEGSKDRPCAIVVAVRTEAGETRVILAPVTHRPSDDLSDSIEIPTPVRRMLGLDDTRQFFRLDELNRFVWPGFDLRPIPGRDGEVAYGMLPKALFERLRRGILDRQAAKQIRIMPREG